MQINDRLHGFTVRSVRHLAELKADLVEMVYEKNGAKLLWLDREDSNMTFAIAFKTVPENSTGVFHILEHSVLNGSRKFPTKEPFVNLLKTSLQTFLNAMTYPDKTVYPVSSRNKQDFLNLVDVYMDAVLYPAIYQKPEIFQQEGWHYEIGENGELIRNGVVFNEMKGAYASVDEQLGDTLNQMLLPDTCYSHDSGGNPKHIPELTYEEFINSHRRFYHPSNSRILLDGSIDTDAVLALLDSYLRDFEASDAEYPVIPLQSPVPYCERTISYEVAPNEPLAGRGQLARGYIVGTYAEREKALALELLTDVLCGSNEAPLKKAILEQGLAQDVRLWLNDSIQQLELELSVRNTDESKVPAINQTVTDVLTKLTAGGIDREQLTASLNAMEFRARERDFGRMPRGLVFALTTLDTWLYGGDPAQNLCFEESFAFLRSQLSTDYFEKLLKEAILDNPHCAQVYAAPSYTCGQEAREQEEKQLAELAASMSAQEKEAIAAQAQRLRLMQQTPDSPEAVATLPKLDVKDIPAKGEALPLDVQAVNGCTVLHSNVDTSGILYADLYFNAADLTLEELPLASLLANLLGQAATEKHGSFALMNALKNDLGSFGCGVEFYTPKGSTKLCTPYFVVSASMLGTKLDAALALVREVLNETVLTDRQLISNVLRQKKLGMRQSILMSGNRYAACRVNAAFTAAGAVGEALTGIDSYRWLCETDTAFSGGDDSLMEKLTALYRRLLCRERLTLSITGEKNDSTVCALMDTVASGAPMGDRTVYAPAGIRKEGFVIPAEVSFAAKGANLYALGIDHCGQMQVAASYLSLDYLWNTIRVQGGAYGCGLGINGNGDVYFTTYRDPSAANSLRSFDAAGQYMRDNVLPQDEIDGLILGTISETDPLLSQRLKGKTAATRYLAGRTQDDLDKLRGEILSADAQSFAEISGKLDAVCRGGAVCVIGGRAILDTCADQLDTIDTLAE